MSMTEQSRPAADAGSGVTDKALIIDCDAHHVPAPEAVAPYLSQRWRDYLNMVGLRTPDAHGLIRARLGASRSDAWSPSGRPPGTDPEFFREQLLDEWNIDAVILNSAAAYLQQYLGGNQPAEFSAELMTAANDWTAEEWFALDDRYYGSICSPFEEADLAVKEIEHRAEQSHWVHVQLPFRTQKPIGNRKYWPLFEAVTHYDLPIGFHPGSIGNNLVTGAGWPSFYFEDHSGLPQALLNQVASLIFEGVFDRFPTLKIIIQEGAWSWVTPYCWRLDRAWSQLRAEVPHLQRKPSDYVREHFWFTSQPVEEPERPQQFMEAWELFGMPDRLMYSSDYPHWDFDSPGALPGVMPEEVRKAVLGANALKLYGDKLADLADRS
jgi:uncharacterized protein